MKLLIYFTIWIISLWGFLYVEDFRNFQSKIEDSGNNMELIWEFDNFYEIVMNITKNWVGYKHETLTKNWNGYLYTIEISLWTQKIRGLSGIFNLNGDVNFDAEWFIERFNLSVWDDIQINGQAEPETPDKILITYVNNSEFNPLDTVEKSKLIDTKELNLDMFFMKTLPFRDLEVDKTYSNKIVNPSFLWNLEKISFSDIQITKTDEYYYEVKQKIWGFNIDIELTFDENQVLTKEKNPVSTSILVKSPDRIETLIDRFKVKEEIEENIIWEIWNEDNETREINNGNNNTSNTTTKTPVKKEIKRCNLLRWF